MSEQEIFEAAATLPVAERAACLDAACEGRPDEWTEDGNTLLAGTRGRTGRFQLWRAPSWEQIEETERNGGGWWRPLE